MKIYLSKLSTLKLVGHVLIVALFFISLHSVQAQVDPESDGCGRITETDGSVTDIFDCDDPFNAAAGFPFDLTTPTDSITSDTQLMLSLPSAQLFTITLNSTTTVDQLAVYQKNGTDLTAVEVDDVVDGEQYNVSFTDTGTYLVVVNYQPVDISLLDTAPWYAKWSLIPTAHAESVGEVFVREFRVVEPTDPAACGLYIRLDFTEDIEDCDAPFGINQPNQDLVIAFGSTTIEADGEYPLTDVASQFEVSNFASHLSYTAFTLWRHDGPDYVEELSFDARRSNPDYRFVTAGTYTIVFEEQLLILTQSPWQKFLSKIIPTAHAADGDQTIVTFIVTDTPTPPEPTGASSVLFLPGIQASRLYAGEDISVAGILNDVQAGERLWEPGNNNDVRALEMTTAGESVHSVYTDDVVDTIDLSLGLGISIAQDDVYDGFGNFMDDLVDDDVIADWAPFAYDWRYDVFDVVNDGTLYEDGRHYPIDELRRLATNSKSGKVTLVAHSNGGLLAKAIMIELEQLMETDLVDQIIMIGTPQLGTPKAIGTVLHGYDQEALGGWVVDDVVARSVINNLPGAYGLLPATSYFAATDKPIVRFDDSESAAPLRDAYGSVITDPATFIDFLTGSNGTLDRALTNVAATPASANPTLLNKSISEQSQLDNWLAPAGVEVIEVVGVGLSTMQSVLYREVLERICSQDSESSTSETCLQKGILKPYAEMTLLGDETVIQTSAEGYRGDKDRYYLNLKNYNDSLVSHGTKSSHFNLTEVISVQSLLKDIFQKSDVDIDFISSSSPVITDEYTIEIIDSPVNILTEDTAGNQSGIIKDGDTTVVKQDIPGSRYFEFGDTKYLITPVGTERTTTLTGTANGSYTLTIANLDAESQDIIHELKNATVTPTMRASYTVKDSEFSTIETDLDADGVTDIEFTVDGVIIDPEPEVVSYDTLKEAIKELALRRPFERLLLLQVRLAERFGNKAESKSVFTRLEDRFLRTLTKTLKRYQRVGRITTTRLESLQGIINRLKQN